MKDPDKMSTRELRNEVKYLRHRRQLILQEIGDPKALAWTGYPKGGGLSTLISKLENIYTIVK